MHVVPAGQGWRWFKAGFALYRAQPIVWIALCFAYWSIMSIAALVPFVGFAASLIMVPIFSVSFMNIARYAELGRRPEFPMLLSGFRGRPKPLVMLGLVYLGLHVLLFAVLLIAAPGGEAGDARPIGDAGIDTDALRATLLRGAALATALYLPIVAAFWYAPVLASWEGHAPGKALFFSFFAVLANWRAFLVYGLIATTLAAAVMLVGILVFGGAAREGGNVLRFAVPLYVATLMPVLFASFYASYRDVFPPAEADPKPLLEQGSS
jgi:hypothetical protein